jgi:hypothetical protein
MGDKTTISQRSRQLEFDFSEFLTATSKPEPANHILTDKGPKILFDTIIKDPPSVTVNDIIGKKVELNKKHVPTKRGWKTLYKLLEDYRNKRYETFRYLFVNASGEIVDHVALTNRVPNRVKTSPDDVKTKDFFDRIIKRVINNNFKIIVVHNHPSGFVVPSEEDKDVTREFQKGFKEYFAGHVILDHGTFGLYIPGKEWEIIERKNIDADPLIKDNAKPVFSHAINGELTQKKAETLRCALQIDDGDQWNSRDWVPVVFTTGWGTIHGIHYYNIQEFTGENAHLHIVKKTTDIAMQTGAVWAFPITDNTAMLEPLRDITSATSIFRDFYVHGTIGSYVVKGGGIGQYFPLTTTYESTFPVGNNSETMSPNPPQMSEPLVAGEADPKSTKAENTHFLKEEHMEDQDNVVDPTLSKEQHKALLEFLGKTTYCSTQKEFDDFYTNITGIRDFSFLVDAIPPQQGIEWQYYKDTLEQEHRKTIGAYQERFPESPLPQVSTLPALFEEGQRGLYTLLDFLSAAEGVSTAGEYREVCNRFPPFERGMVKAVSPQKIALFHEGAALPLLLEDNTPDNWAKLYTAADNNGIAVNNCIPSPEDVETLGVGLIAEAQDRLRNAMSMQWQRDEFLKDCRIARAMPPYQDQGYPDEAQVLKAFVEKPYTIGTVVPPFGLQDGGTLQPYNGFSFDRMTDDGVSVSLKKAAQDGKTETVAISSRLYQEMIHNAETQIKRPPIPRESIAQYNSLIPQDEKETRANTAVNFWHNYKTLCRQQASNPKEAMEVAKAIVQQMRPMERKKFERNVREYEKATRQLVDNPLLRPFVKPQETYDQRILNYYEQNVADLPIKNRTVHGADALVTIRRGVESFEELGKPVEPLHRLKIGDTVKVSLDCRTLFGEQRKRLPITEYTVTAFSTDLNKVVLIDKKGHSKYTLAKDTFVEKMQRLEKKLERKQVKQDRFESIRY